MGDPTDADLLDAFRAGDVRAFETLVRRYQRPVLAIARRFARDLDDAEDLAQRAFINCESLFRPAGLIPPFFLFGVVFVPAFILAQRALAAAASLARVAADMRRRPSRVGALEGEPPRTEEKRFSNASICRRIEIAS